MRRLIDVDKFLEDVKRDREHEIYLHSWTADMVLKRLDSWYAPTVEAIPKDQYEQRLKADMVAMLDKLMRKMKERDEDNSGKPLNVIDQGYHLAYEHLCEEIDNLLKENEDGSN